MARRRVVAAVALALIAACGGETIRDADPADGSAGTGASGGVLFGGGGSAASSGSGGSAASSGSGGSAAGSGSGGSAAGSGSGGSAAGSGSGGSAASGGSSGSGGLGGCAPLGDCDGNCVDFQTDSSHCGGCYEICSEGQWCQGGTCKSIPCYELVEAEDEAKVKHTSGWNNAYGNVCHGGICMETYTQVSNDTLGLKIYGSGLVVYYARGPNRGDLRVSIDGQDVAYIEGHVEKDFQFQVPVVVAAGLPAGWHEVLVHCVPGTGYCDVDYFASICP